MGLPQRMLGEKALPATARMRKVVLTLDPHKQRDRKRLERIFQVSLSKPAGVSV